MAKRSHKRKKRTSQLLAMTKSIATASRDGVADAKLPLDQYGRGMLAQLKSDGTYRLIWPHIYLSEREPWKKIHEAPASILRVLCRLDWKPRELMSPLEQLAHAAG